MRDAGLEAWMSDATVLRQAEAAGYADAGGDLTLEERLDRILESIAENARESDRDA